MEYNRRVKRIYWGVACALLALLAVLVGTYYGMLRETGLLPTREGRMLETAGIQLPSRGEQLLHAFQGETPEDGSGYELYALAVEYAPDDAWTRGEFELPEDLSLLVEGMGKAESLARRWSWVKTPEDVPPGEEWACYYGEGTLLVWRRFGLGHAGQ